MSVFKLLYVQNIHFDKSMLFLFFYFLFGGFLFEDNVLSFLAHIVSHIWQCMQKEPGVKTLKFHSHQLELNPHHHFTPPQTPQFNEME